MRCFICNAQKGTEKFDTTHYACLPCIKNILPDPENISMEEKVALIRAHIKRSRRRKYVKRG